MAIYRPAIQKPIPPGPNDPRLDVVVGTVGHVAVSEADSLYNWFNGPSGGVESHFYIRYDGTVEQYRDTAYEADAQGAGNSWVIGNQRYGYVSYETEGLGSGKWTSAQLTSIKALIKWVNETHGSPWQKTPAYHGRGHGYHSQFSQWNPDGHSCPGPFRIKQFNTIIVPWLDDHGKEIDLPLTDTDVLKIWTTPITTKGSWPYTNDLESMMDIVTRIARNVETVGDLEKANSVDKIVSATIAALPTASVDKDELAAALAKAIQELATG